MEDLLAGIEKSKEHETAIWFAKRLNAMWATKGDIPRERFERILGDLLLELDMPVLGKLCGLSLVDSLIRLGANDEEIIGLLDEIGLLLPGQEAA